MIDGSEKRNRQLALNFRIRMFVKSAVRSQSLATFSNFRKSVYFVPETLHRIQVSFRPPPHISGYFLIHNVFFP